MASLKATYFFFLFLVVLVITLLFSLNTGPSNAPATTRTASLSPLDPLVDELKTLIIENDSFEMSGKRGTDVFTDENEYQTMLSFKDPQPETWAYTMPDYVSAGRSPRDCEISLYTAECLLVRYEVEVAKRNLKPTKVNLEYIRQFKLTISEQCLELVSVWEFSYSLEDCLTTIDGGNPVIGVITDKLIQRQIDEEEDRLDREFFVWFSEQFTYFFRGLLICYFVLRVIKFFFWR